MLLRLEGVSRSFAGRTLFEEVSLEVAPGDRIGLIGANGVGKTSLLRILAGQEPPDAGSVRKPREVRVKLLEQEIDPARETSVFAETSTALAALEDLERELAALEAEMQRCGSEGREVPGPLAERYDRARHDFASAGGFERGARVEKVLEGLGFDAAARRRPLRAFSGGWIMRVELAKLLLSAPDVLLLDEPGNHLDLPSIEWFEETLRAYPGAVVVVSHDRTFLRRHATRIAELERRCLHLYAGGYDAYQKHKALRQEQLLATKRSQDRKIAQTERFIERFRAKNTKASQVQSRVKALEKLDRIELPQEGARRMRLQIPPPRRAGREVLRLSGVHKRYGETVVYRGLDFLVERGQRVALVGPNGAGKSTLLGIAAGAVAADRGERRLGANVDAAFFAQHQREALDASRSVLEELAAGASTDDVPRLRGHLGAFLFSGDDVEKRVGVLSGGEKARLALAKLLLRPVNFLILDEPTNHLDLVAREVLEAALGAYSGTLLFISHDRAFIENVATRVVEVSGGALIERPQGLGDPLGGAERSAGPALPAPSKQSRMAAREDAKERARQLARQRKRVAALEQAITALEEQLGELALRMTQPEVYRDGDAVRELREREQDLRDALADRYREWEEAAAALESQAD